MTVATDLKKTAAETGYAVVGLTDLAVERVKTAQQRAAALRYELERVEPAEGLKKIQTRVQQLPTTAVGAGVEAATKAEAAFGDLAARGKVLVERIREQRSTKDLVEQGKQTISRGKAAVTTIRRGASATVATAEDTVQTAEADAAAVAVEVKTAARQRTQRTRTAAKRTATTARKRTTAAKDQTKAAVNSAKETADVAVEAVEESAEKIGD